MTEYRRLLRTFDLTPRRGWIVLSPDGLPIEPRTYPFALAALAALETWCDRFAGQGYYAAAAGERIPLAELAARCRLIAPPPRPRPGR